MNPPSPQTIPAWLTRIGDLPDHYHGQSWSAGVMPNNFLFFLRTRKDQLSPLGVTHNLHHRYELILNYSGSGTLCIGDHLFPFTPGNAVLVPPGMFHYYFNTRPDTFHWLFFTFELDSERNPALPSSAPVSLEPADLDRVESAACSYLTPLHEQDIFESGLIMGRLLETMTTRAAVPAFSSSEAVPFCDLLRKITLFVDAHMEDALRIQDVAAHLGLSESHLRKIFREEAGTSLGEYLRRSRLTRGVQLIHRSDLSITAVSRLCGFESIHAFSQSFTRAIGMPPTAYRKYLLEGNTPVRIPLEANAPASLETPVS